VGLTKKDRVELELGGIHAQIAQKPMPLKEMAKNYGIST
jgi:hypothetical protein